MGTFAPGPGSRNATIVGPSSRTRYCRKSTGRGIMEVIATALIPETLRITSSDDQRRPCVLIE